MCCFNVQRPILCHRVLLLEFLIKVLWIGALAAGKLPRAVEQMAGRFVVVIPQVGNRGA
jgi:hypothetical protein